LSQDHRKFIESLLEQHQSGRTTIAVKLWLLLTLSEWFNTTSHDTKTNRSSISLPAWSLGGAEQAWPTISISNGFDQCHLLLIATGTIGKLTAKWIQSIRLKNAMAVADIDNSILQNRPPDKT